MQIFRQFKIQLSNRVVPSFPKLCLDIRKSLQKLPDDKETDSDGFCIGCWSGRFEADRLVQLVV